MKYREKIAFQSKADHPRAHLCSCDLDLDPMTLIQLDLKIPKMYPDIKNELHMSRLS